MKNFNYLQTILASLFVFLPIFPHSNSIDFGGYTDPSLILIIIFLATGINSNRIIGLAFTIFLYLSINDYVGYADTFSKTFLFLTFFYFIRKYYWRSTINDVLMIFSFLILHSFLVFAIYRHLYNVNLIDYVNMVTIPLLYNSLISIIMLFMIKYTSWPHYPEKTFQS